MPNKSLFASLRGALTPKTDTLNSEKTPAYAMPRKHALAQYAATGCLGHTFYATADEQLERTLQLCEDLEPEFVAKVAIYSRKQAFMKDMPALLCAWLSTRDACLHELVFAQVIDDTRMLRNYVQILRSGVVGRKSLGSAPKRLVREWLASRDEEVLFRSSAGQSPSLSDIVKNGASEARGRTPACLLRLYAVADARGERAAQVGLAVRAVQDWRQSGSA